MGVVSKSTTYPAKINQGVDERFTDARSLWIQLYCKITNVRGQMISKEVVATLMNLLGTNLSQVNTFINSPVHCQQPSCAQWTSL
jgi:hypothetical protein